jgi:hypothetical protein
MRGEPERIMRATAEEKYLLVWPHGDETLGPLVGHHIATERPDLLEHVNYMCGNPRAASQTPPQRHTNGITPGYTAKGTDLNRSYSPSKKPESYEEWRAQEILRETRNHRLTLDLHTSTTDIGRCMLISERYRDDEGVREIIAASPISRIVVLPENITMPNGAQVELATTGLIGNVAGSVSVEYNRELAAETGVEDTLLLIDGLVSGTPRVAPQEREFFNVSDFVLKTQDPGEDAKNFKMCDLGYYPVLYGENSYRKDPTKPYLGFAAATREIEII